MKDVNFHIYGDMNVFSVKSAEDRQLFEVKTEIPEQSGVPPGNYGKEPEGYTDMDADQYTDPLVLVLWPGKERQILTEGECWDKVESHGIFDRVEKITGEGISICYDGNSLIMLGEGRFLTGPVVVFDSDEEGDSLSVTAHGIQAATKYFWERTVILGSSQGDFPAFRL